MLGTAAGTTARAYAHYFPDTEIDAVEIDGELLDIGRRYFDLEPRPAAARASPRTRGPFLRGTHGALRRDLRRRLPPAVHPVLPDDQGVLRSSRATGSRPGGVVVDQRRPPRGLRQAREGAERHARHRRSRTSRATRSSARTRSSSPPTRPPSRDTLLQRAGVAARLISSRSRSAPPAARAGADGRPRLHRRPRAGRVAGRQLDRARRGRRRRVRPAAGRASVSYCLNGS